MIQKVFPAFATWQRRSFPLKVKQVPTINLGALSGLSTADAQCRTFNDNMLQWLTEPTRYHGLQGAGAAKQTGFSAEDERLMSGTKFSPTPRHLIKAWVYGFKVSEAAKERCRPVWNTYINQKLNRACLPHYHLPSLNDVWETIGRTRHHPNTIFVQFDVSSMYDHFPLAPEVQQYFGFVARDGSCQTLTVLPMGFTLACAIAQSTTWRLLDFERRSTAISYIDNVAFMGSPEQVHHDVTEFFLRCVTVGFVLNEVSPRDWLQLSRLQQLTQINDWHHDNFEFLGTRFDWTHGLQMNTPKTIDKLQVLKSLVVSSASLTLKQLAAVVGVARYANRISGTSLLEFYPLLETFRVFAREVALSQDWDRPINLYFKQPLLQWLDEEIRNIPRTILLRLRPVGMPFVFTDASTTGWGAVWLDRGTCRTVAGRWLYERPSSVDAEPAAVVEALQALKPFIDHRGVILITDHLPLVLAAHSAAPRCKAYNDALLHIRGMAIDTRFAFLSGVNNPADPLSRGIPTINIPQVTQTYGTGWQPALLHENRVCSMCSGRLPWMV